MGSSNEDVQTNQESSQIPPSRPQSAYTPAFTKKEKSIYDTTLATGEIIPKSDKLISAIGSVEELFSYIGILKAEHFNASSERKFDIENSSKVFLFGRMTQIQESLLDIIISLGTSKKINPKYDASRFISDFRIKEFEQHIENMKSYGSNTALNWPQKNINIIISGTSVLEAQLIHARSICRRAERQVISSKNMSSGFIPEDSIIEYLNKLGDYLYCLSIHVLHLFSKEPMKRTGKK